MARFWQYLIALAAILATVVILTVKDPYAGGEAGENSPEFSADPSSGPIPPPPIAPLAEETAETPRKPVSSWFELERGDGLSLVLSGTLRDGHVKSRLVESARGKVPELVEVMPHFKSSFENNEPQRIRRIQSWHKHLESLYIYLRQKMDYLEQQCLAVETAVSQAQTELQTLIEQHWQEAENE